MNAFAKHVVGFQRDAPVDRSLTLEQIGNIMGVSRERVRQIEAQALRKLRHPSRINILRDHQA